MLKSTFNAAKPSEPKRPTLPHLFQSIVYGHVVLFFDEHEGTEVLVRGITRSLRHCEGWFSCWDSEVWTPLKPGESVTITVEQD